MDRKEIIEKFVKSFIRKDKRERALLELLNYKKRDKFLDKLNHKWNSYFNMNLLERIPKGPNTFEFVMKELNIAENETCYVISNYDDIDNQFLPFKEAFDNSYSRGFASLIINKTCDKLFLETEISIRDINRFIGKK